MLKTSCRFLQCNANALLQPIYLVYSLVLLWLTDSATCKFFSVKFVGYFRTFDDDSEKAQHQFLFCQVRSTSDVIQCNVACRFFPTKSLILPFSTFMRNADLLFCISNFLKQLFYFTKFSLSLVFIEYCFFCWLLLIILNLCINQSTHCKKNSIFFCTSSFKDKIIFDSFKRTKFFNLLKVENSIF